jgi:hypothetical protein
MLSKKSPRTNCRIIIRNNRIGATGFLNQRCTLALDLNQSCALGLAKSFFDSIGQGLRVSKRANVFRFTPKTYRDSGHPNRQFGANRQKGQERLSRTTRGSAIASHLQPVRTQRNQPPGIAFLLERHNGDRATISSKHSGVGSRTHQSIKNSSARSVA